LLRLERFGSGDRPILELRNVSTHYGLIAVLREVSLEIYPGEIVCLLGGSASGKSTTLRTILGMATPSEGEVWYDGRPIAACSRA
jgi:branched-chain amino acid transport system ATP-binding protein